MPLSSGIVTSRIAMSGRSSIASWTASRPFPASPTTVHSGLVSRIFLTPLRTSVWSSARRIRTLAINHHRITERSRGGRHRGVFRLRPHRPRGQIHADARAAAGRTQKLHRATDAGGALAHADQAQSSGLRERHLTESHAIIVDL